MTFDHRAAYIEFGRLELQSGGPDPQVLLTARGLDVFQESIAAVAAGHFVVPYTCGAAAALWSSSAWAMGPSLQDWLVANSAGLPTRRERRAIWGDDKRKFYESLTSWGRWATQTLPTMDRAPYPVLYESIKDNVAYFGRYATMKVLEVLYQRGIIAHGQSDIRAHGATFPRRTLALLFPQDAEVLTSKSDKPEVIRLCDERAAQAKEWLGTTWFQTETLLCNYRQSLAGKYPGRSHDRELSHWVTAANYWGGHRLDAAFPFYDMRMKLFGREYLGELGTPQWWGARVDLEQEYRRKVNPDVHPADTASGDADNEE